VRLRRVFAGAAIAVAALAFAAYVQAQGSYPSKPIRMVVGFPPGGGMDLSARVYSAKLQDALSTPIVVENRPGGTGLLAGEHVARSAPDGYTLLVGASGQMTINPVLMAEHPYDTVRDFAAITVAESGVPGYDISVWAGLFAPAGTSQAVVARLYREASRAMSAPDTREKLRNIGMDPGGLAPERLAAMIKADIVRYGAIVKAAGIKAE